MAPTDSFPFSATNLPKQLFINNEYVDSSSDKKLTLFNPKDGSLVADDVPLAGKQDVDTAVSAAQAAFPAWRKIPNKARQEMMLKFADLLERHAETLAELTRITMGMPVSTGKGEAGIYVQVRV